METSTESAYQLVSAQDLPTGNFRSASPLSTFLCSKLPMRACKFFLLLEGSLEQFTLSSISSREFALPLLAFISSNQRRHGFVSFWILSETMGNTTPFPSSDVHFILRQPAEVLPSKSPETSSIGVLIQIRQAYANLKKMQNQMRDILAEI